MNFIKKHLEEFGILYGVGIIIIFFIIFCLYGFLDIYSLCVDINEKESLVARIDEYEKILEREFGQIFNSYNEYLVYKIENGGVN